ncbi:MAG: NAD-glutamate dehydrogenase, partial [Proteobacteria bacterium]|nr:NAD-glutamate dehydrogenase [Pseudomonadota bacterium]
MTANSIHRRNPQLDAAIALANEGRFGARASLVGRFILRYYADMLAEDLDQRDPLDLFGAAVAHLEFAEIRRQGTPNVRVYNPIVEQHGWNSKRTVIEIVTDDMPFLVDSIRMMVSDRKLATRLIIHPL